MATLALSPVLFFHCWLMVGIQKENWDGDDAKQ